ncbi:MAG: hypothetical protein JXB04_03500 [Kiritimatiellae bacterium]|nr:hypothetical protein [Kiritimatiellia bacterium]
MNRRHPFALFASTCLAALLAGCMPRLDLEPEAAPPAAPPAPATPAAPAEPTRLTGQDPAIVLLLKEINDRQPAPYGLPDDSTYNYIWAQNMMALLAAERCGYMDRHETLARLNGMLDSIERLERHHGFFYDRYNVRTGKKETDQIYFQGWWLFGLAVLKNAYPELAPRCRRLLDAVDYEKGGMFNPETLEMAADFWPEEGRHNWVNFFWGPAGEMRSPYVAYTYLTGDIRPWTKKEVPGFMNVEGHQVLRVWHHFVFCSMLMHSVFPDFGYFERSWDELLQGLDAYREKNGMVFYPTRAEPLEAWAADMPLKDGINVEHRIAKPWLAWFRDPAAPVIEKAFTPGHGISLYYDNMNLYWCHGGEPTACPHPVDQRGSYRFPFHVSLLPERYSVAHPPKLTSVQLIASCGRDSRQPDAPLEIRLNGTVVAKVDPGMLGESTQPVNLPLEHVVLTSRSNMIEIVSRASAGRGYTLHRFENPLAKAHYVARSGKPRDVPPPYFEITIDGQADGGENAYAVLARCAAIHGYYVWHEMLGDPQFLENTVVWVGDYHSRARIGRVVYNVSDKAVTVEYERPAEWTTAEAIVVSDITDGADAAITPRVLRQNILWRAEPWHTYRIGYAGATMETHPQPLQGGEPE